MEIINPEQYQRFAAEATAAEFSGWDFNWLEGRMVQEQTPWDYPSLVRDNILTGEGFSPKSHFERLMQIHNIIELEGRFITTAHRFLFVG